MAIDILQTADVIETLENFLDKRRPPEEMRSQLDLSYKIENQSVTIYEIRPGWDKPNEIIETPVAKITWVKARELWKLFWMRGDLKWHSYKPKPTVKTMLEFVKTVDEDKYGCFWG
jgi:hypothetical protein